MGYTRYCIPDEVLAILYCGLELLSGPRQEDTINICSDSRAAIMEISAEVVHSKLVLECKITLEKLAQKNDIHLVWVPGHVAIPGNEEVDRLAKLGLLTGHCQLRRHQYLMSITEDPTCRGCLEEEESAAHFLMWCAAFTRSRTTFMGQSIISRVDSTYIKNRRQNVI